LAELARAGGSLNSHEPFQHNLSNFDALSGIRGLIMQLSRRTFIAQSLTGMAVIAVPLGAANAASLQSAGAQYINAYRAQSGLAPLRANRVLTSVADLQCRLMIANGRIGHEFGPGTRLGQRLVKAGGEPRLIAENVARGQSGIPEVMAAWMHSPGHRRNMLHPRMTEFGLAQKSVNGQPYWALVLGG
jgi:uncharacterized protein YkwD